MDVEDVEDVDQYITQLRDVFDSCDVYDQGYLSRNELLALCHKLQLDDQAEDIVNHLTDNAQCEQVGEIIITINVLCEQVGEIIITVNAQCEQVGKII